MNNPMTPSAGSGTPVAPTVPSATDELTHLNIVVVEHEKHAFTVMTFLAAVIAGLATVVLTTKTKLGVPVIDFVGLLSVFGFSVWTLAHRAIADMALNRVKEIEDGLAKTPPQYDYYQVSHRVQDSGPQNFFSAMRHFSFMIPAVMGVAAVFVISFLSSRLNREDSVEESFESSVSEIVKPHLIMLTKIEANGTTAMVTAKVPQQGCTLKFAKSSQSAGTWAISEVACQQEPQRQIATDENSSRTGAPQNKSEADGSGDRGAEKPKSPRP
jgi:hypothetical protein